MDTVAKLLGIGSTVVSGNNKFLIEMGIIANGKNRTVTQLGSELGRALEHSQEDEVAQSWQKAIKHNEQLSDLITSIRLKGGIAKDSFTSHILFTSGQNTTKHTRTGARTIADILTTSGLVELEENTFQVAKPQEDAVVESDPVSKTIGAEVQENSDDVAEAREKTKPSVSLTVPTVAINIQLHLPATENAEIYENLFIALRKHLLDSNE